MPRFSALVRTASCNIGLRFSRRRNRCSSRTSSVVGAIAFASTRARLVHQDGHLPEHLAPPKAPGLAGVLQFDRARGDEEDAARRPVPADHRLSGTDIAGTEPLGELGQRLFIEIGEQGELPDQFGPLHRQVELGPVLGGGAAVGNALHQRGVQFRSDQTVGAHDGIFPLFQPQGGAADEPALQLFGIARILQAQPVERGIHRLGPAAQQIVQQVGQPAAVDAPDAAVDKAVQVAQDQPLRQQQFETVGGEPRQRPRDTEAIVQHHRNPEGAAIADAFARRLAIAGAPAGMGGFDQPVGIRQQPFRQPGRDRVFAHPGDDGVAFCPGQRQQAQRDPVAVEDLGAVLGLFHRAFQTVAEPLGLGPHDVVAQFIVLGRPGDILAHRLQRDGDDLL